MNTRTIAIAIGLLLAGCRTNDRNGALVITKVVVGTAQGGAGGGCTLSPGGNETLFPTYAVVPPGAPTLGALAGFVVLNQLINPSTLNAALNTATNNFSPHQAVVDYEIPGQSVPQQIIFASGTVPTNTSVPVGVELASPTAVQSAIAAAITASPTGDVFIRTTVRIEGRLDDGTVASTSAHEFVFRACTGGGANCGGDPCF